MKSTIKYLLVCAAALSIGQAICVDAAEPLTLTATVALNGVKGRLDHLAIDVKGKRLFVAALGNNTVEVVDLATAKVTGRISNLAEPQGTAYLATPELIAVANGTDGTCRFYNAKSLDARASFDFQADADNLRYDDSVDRLYVGFGEGAIGIIDARSQKRIGEIKLAGHPEAFQLEAAGNRIFVNVPSVNQIAVLDRRSESQITSWKVTAARANFPMTLDESHHRLFVGCREPGTVLVYDTQSGELIGQYPSVGDADDLFYDPRTKRLYVTGGEGFIAVHEESPDKSFGLVAKIATAKGARTSLFSPALSQLYVAVPRHGTQAAELRIYQTQ